ncbi:hypothetical protein P691DRAFT_781840 [Macrolepiota fuliginosa MF-IS2]|uniref:Uncharacterized protein n=1 Tax=Macrolepiota fuliginosa MF-IS2 TaxID=1400762 RepID=A0A9P5WY53_9AGAR|nr:hypothetical protein P691DRAFT_781840 [Macrolepiota fuliginosa MF-IS2]
MDQSLLMCFFLCVLLHTANTHPYPMEVTGDVLEKTKVQATRHISAWLQIFRKAGTKKIECALIAQLSKALVQCWLEIEGAYPDAEGMIEIGLIKPSHTLNSVSHKHSTFKVIYKGWVIGTMHVPDMWWSVGPSWEGIDVGKTFWSWGLIGFNVIMVPRA